VGPVDVRGLAQDGYSKTNGAARHNGHGDMPRKRHRDDSPPRGRRSLSPRGRRSPPLGPPPHKDDSGRDQQDSLTRGRRSPSPKRRRRSPSLRGQRSRDLEASKTGTARENSRSQQNRNLGGLRAPGGPRSRSPRGRRSPPLGPPPHRDDSGRDQQDSLTLGRRSPSPKRRRRSPSLRGQRCKIGTAREISRSQQNRNRSPGGFRVPGGPRERSRSPRTDQRSNTRRNEQSLNQPRNGGKGGGTRERPRTDQRSNTLKNEQPRNYPEQSFNGEAKGGGNYPEHSRNGGKGGKGGGKGGIGGLDGISKGHKRLQQQIVHDCKTAVQVLELSDRAASMDAVNIATAIHRIAKYMPNDRSKLDLSVDERFQRSESSS
jgi:hypothetical protein